MSKIGIWAFAVGLILAVVVAVVGSESPWAIFAIAVFGVIAGLLNVTDKEVQTFLIAAIAFLLSANALGVVFTQAAFGWAPIGKFFSLLSVFFAPAAAIVAVKALYNITKD